MVISGQKPGGTFGFSDDLANAFHQEAPFYDLVMRKGGKKKFNGEVAKGHNWTVGNLLYTPKKNAKAPAGCENDETYTPPAEYHNELQTFYKNSSIADEVVAEKGNRTSNMTLEEIQFQKRRELVLDIEFSFLADTPPKASTDNKTDPREMAGIKHFIPTVADIDMGGAALKPYKDVSASLQTLFENGVKGNYVMICGVDVYSDVIEFYNDKLQIRTGETKGGVKIKEVTTGFGDVEVMPVAALDADEYIVLGMDYIDIIEHRQYKNKVISTEVCDATETQDLVQHTLEVAPPALVRRYNVGRKA